MKKYIVSLVVIFLFATYIFFLHHSDDVHVVAPSTLSTASGPATTPSSAGSTKATSYKDGTYTGTVADAYYGSMQVQATISGGKITDVAYVQYPSDRGESVQINTQALPYLKQEVIAAQNANVQIISGATQSSTAFKESLTSALLQAQS